MTTQAAASEAPKPVSKYTIEDTPEGFVIKREGGLEVAVTYENTWLRVGTRNAALFQYSGLVDTVAGWFLDHLISGYFNKRKTRDGIAMIARALSKRMKPHWQRLVTEIVPKEVSELARLMWSSVHGDARILHEPALYTDAYKHLRSDLKRYHACRVIVKRDEADLQSGPLLDSAPQWRTLYAQNVVSPKALNKTLDKLPRGLSFHSINLLRHVHLEQPITDRLHLMAVLSGADHFHWYMHEQTVLKASNEQIIEAGEVIGVRLQKQSRTQTVAGAMQYILDYPAPFYGDLLGLARRSQEWHRTNVYEGDDGGYLLADTVLPLLTLDYEALASLGVTPLRTVGEVVREGDDMRHCVGSYARRAYLGHSFLFHVEYEQEKATIELSREGFVRQAYGPHNTINKACRWGTEALRNASQQSTMAVIPAIPF